MFGAKHPCAFTASTIPKYEAPFVDVDGSTGTFYYGTRRLIWNIHYLCFVILMLLFYLTLADSGESNTHTTKVPLIMIPGSAQSIQSLGPHIKAVTKWRRLIIPEFRCHGTQTTLKHEFSSMSQLTEDLGKLINYLDLTNADLCGFSLGGRIALAYGITPDNRVRKISVTGVPLLRPPLGRSIMQSWAAGLEAEEIVSCCWSFLINGYSVNWLQQNRAHLSKFVDAVIKSNDVHRLKHLFRFSMSEQADDPTSVSQCAHQLTCPVQIIGGSDDRLCAVESIIALHESIPQSTLVVMPNTGHLAPFEQPAQWRQHVLSYLDS